MTRAVLFAVLAVYMVTSAASCGGGGGGAQNQSPSAVIDASETPLVAPVEIQFDGSGSFDADGTIAFFEWDFEGDGVVDLTSSQPDASFVYQTPGVKNPRLKVTDNQGASDSASLTLLVTAVALTSTQIGGGGFVATGGALSAATVGGNPAVVFSSSQGLAFCRASDIAGANWGEPVLIDAEGIASVQLVVVDGNPAVAYMSTRFELAVQFCRATDSLGTQWGEPAAIFTDVVPPDSGAADLSLLIVEGRPAIVFEVVANDFQTLIAYRRAADAQGNGFNAGEFIEIVGLGLGAQDPVALIVAGRPAVVFEQGDALSFMRSLDPLGDAWPAAATVINADTSVENKLSVAIVGGNPAVSWRSNNLLLARANDANGDGWGPSRVVVDDDEVIAEKPSLLTIGNLTVIGFDSNTGNDLGVIVSNSPAAASFPTRILFEAESVFDLDLLDVGGALGVAYLESGDTLNFGLIQQAP